MKCPKCQAEGPTGAVYCVGCGYSRAMVGRGSWRWLISFAALTVGWLVAMFSLAPLLITHPADLANLGLSALTLLLGLVILPRPCSHPDGEGRNFCPDCGAAGSQAGNPFRLALVLFGSAAVSVALFLCHWMASGALALEP
ncbi:hypothetical protein JST97_10840 [bacterium]|nr:hypothetical protein [bacterium]